uniref:Uncharacterized protein n=1 Tax=Romanomermis culicivorax TaxID=13658 RepID=A0A915IFA2_ROMCU
MQILLIAVFYPLWSTTMVASQTCPENLRPICTRKCSFLDGFLDLDCSPAQDLRELIKQLRSTNKPIRSLRMGDNANFVELPGKVFDTLKIKKLDLSSNGLTGISPRAFMGLEDSLTDLNLAANKLTSIPDVANLRLLESLDISGNQLTGGEVKHDLFAHNPKLHVVKIDPDKAIYLLQDKADKVSDFLPPAAPAPVAQVPSQQVVAAPPKIVDPTNSLNNPMNTLIFTSLLSDLLRNLPSIISGLQALQAISLRNNDGSAAPAPLFPNLLAAPVDKSLATQLDAAKITPDFVRDVMANGAKIPGVPPDVTAALTQKYLQEMVKGNGQAAAQLIPSPATPMMRGPTVATPEAAPVVAPATPDKANVSSASTGGFSALVRQFTDLLANPNAPLPPLDSLPADLVSKVLSGGLIPGNKVQNKNSETCFEALTIDLCLR